MAVLPIVRIPFYHTGAYFLPRPAMDALEALYRASGEPLTYQLHGVDLLALEDRGVDPRLACHPGMRLPLARKRALLRRRLLRIARGWRCRTLGELVDETCGGLRLPVRADGLRAERRTGAGSGDSRNGSHRGQVLRGGRL